MNDTEAKIQNVQPDSPKRSSEDELLIVLSKLREQFTTVYYVDFSTNYARTYKTDDDYGKDYGNLQQYWEPFSTYVRRSVPEYDQERMLTLLQPSYIMERFRTEDVYEIEFEDHAYGEMRYCKFRFIKVSEDGSQCVICGFDETAKIKAEKDARKAMMKNLGVINALGSEYENLFLVDIDTGEYTHFRADDSGIHKAALETSLVFSNYREALDSYFDHYVVEEDRAYLREHTATQALLDETPDSGIHSLNYRRIDGDRKLHYQLNSAKFNDEDGTCYLVIGFRDVDAMVREEERKNAELSTMQAIIAASEMGTWRIELIDGKAPRMLADNRMLELLGLPGRTDMSPEEVYNAWFDRIKPDAVASVLESVEKMKSGERDENTYLWIHPALGERFVRCGGTARPIEGGYMLRGYHYDVDDIVREQQKQSQLLKDALAAAEHANHAKTTFLNNMSHDIRTPMNAIIGYTALAASHIDNKVQVQDYLSKITTSSSHLLALINDVLDMSRIESGKVSIDQQAMSLPDVMHDIRNISQANISAKQLDFFIDAVDVAHEGIVCDKLRLQQVLLNILSNAVKFTEVGGAIGLRVVEKPSHTPNHARYEFRVKDNGIGMSEEFQQHIFEPFTREETSTVSGIQGTGLGMAITKNIIDMMGGTISVNSRLGEGTEFLVTLDCPVTGEKAVYERVEELQGIRALVADDDSHTAISVSNMLKDIGLRADWTLSGKEAVLRSKVALEEADEYGVYIIDWMMPDMNGIETVRQIRAHIGDSAPIIILTAYDWADIEEEAYAAGVTAFVSKPIFMSELRDVLSRPFRAGEVEVEEPALTIEDVAGTKILLVEDNAMNQEIAQAILEQYGFDVDIVDDGSRAVEAMRGNPSGTYDLVLMDIQMPGMDGYEATRAIRQLPDAAIAATPIVAMSANAFDEDRAKARDAGMDGYITKPIDIEKMLQVVSGFANR
jgi:signal transduction histidine kinase/CheY-like chemotaxis protein